MEKIMNFIKGHKALSVIIGVVIIALIVAVICLVSKPNNATVDNGREIVKPTFMYFVSKSDETYEEEMKVVEALKKDFEDEVVFDIKDVDENPDAIKSFPMVDNNTPFLIMLDRYNDLSVFKPGVVDQKELKGYIKEALKK